jgi:hypothetical protein
MLIESIAQIGQWKVPTAHIGKVALTDIDLTVKCSGDPRVVISDLETVIGQLKGWIDYLDILK